MSDDTKIKFYSLGSEKIDLLKKMGNDDFDFSKAIFSSPNFDNALAKVIEKDIDSLDIKVNKIINEIKTRFSNIGANINLDRVYSISDINKVNAFMDKSLKDLMEFKSDNKVRLFSFDKKTKKQKILLIDNAIDYIKKSKIEILTMKDEYIKLCKRKETLSLQEEYDMQEDTYENPLERTINFYMSQEEVNN